MENNQTNQISYLLGHLTGEIFCALLSLALITSIVFVCWNYVLVDTISHLGKINIWQSTLLILTFRAIRFNKLNKN